MVKTRQAHIRAEVIGNEMSADYHGKENDLAEMVERMTVDMVENRPAMRRKLRRAMRSAMWQTAPDWLHYLCDGWQLTLVGVGILTLVVYGLCWVMHGVVGV